MTTTTPLYDRHAWWLGADVKWNMRFLHVVGHSVSPREWDASQRMRKVGFDPDEAARQINSKRHAFRSHGGV